MAAINDVTLLNNDTSNSFFFRAVTPFRSRKSQPATALPLINTSSTNTVLFRFFGQSEEVSFTFVLFDDGTDVADGTYTSTVISLAEQIHYLRDVIYSDNFDVDWTLTQLVFYTAGLDGVITNLDIDQVSPKIAVGNFTIKRGRIGLL